MKWAFEKYCIAAVGGIRQVEGYTYAGLGLHVKCVARGPQPPLWVLSHLMSGHRVFFIKAPYEKAIKLATEIAEMSDWTFNGLTGWKNMDPHLKEKAIDIETRYKEVYRGDTETVPKNEEQAREIMMARDPK